MPIPTTDPAGRSTFGGTDNDFLFRTVAGGLVKLQTGYLTYWDAEVDGNQYNDLILGGEPVEVIPADDLGYYPEFQGPVGVTQMWAESSTTNRRTLVVAIRDIAAKATQIVDQAFAAAESIERDQPNGVAPLDSTQRLPLERAPLGVARVDEAPLNALREGIKGDTSDDTAAWTAFMAKLASAGSRREGYVPPLPSYSKVTSTVTIPDGVHLFAADQNHAEIRGTGSADTLAFASGSNQRLENIYASASGGGNVVAIDNSYGGSLRNCLLVQYVATKHVLRHGGSGSFIDMTVDKVTFNAAPGASVAPIHLENSANGLNGTQWRDCRLNGNATMTAPFIRMLNVSAAANGIYLNNHTFRDITAEICIAGVLHATSVNGVTVDHVVPWDVATEYIDDIFKFSPQPGGGLVCRNIDVAHSGRRGGGLAAGKYDVNFSPDSTECTAFHMAPAHLPLTAAKILLPNSNGLKFACGGPGPVIESSYGGTIKLPNMSTTDRPSAAAAGDGAMFRNSTTKAIQISDGTVWRDALGTAV